MSEHAAVSAERRRHMARASVLVMAAFLGSKVVGLLRARAISFEFGASMEYDAYVAAFRVPDMLFALFAGGALVSAFLPVFSDYLAHDDDEGAWRLASSVTNLVFLTTLALSALAFLFAPSLVAALAPGFDAAQQALTVQLMRIVLLSTLIFSLSGIQMGELNALQHFLTPALAPIVYNLGILFGALFLAPRLGIYGLAWGVVLGALGHLLIKLPALLRRGFRWWPILELGDRGVRLVLWLMWPRVLSLATVYFVRLVEVRLASQIIVGSLSALDYAWLLSQMPQTILGTAIATVAFPTLAELAALGRTADLRRIAVDALRIMLVLSVPAAIALWVLAGPVVAALLVTGAFDADAAAATAFALRMFAIGLVGHVTLEIVMRLYYAQKDTITPLGIATFAMVLNIALAYLFVSLLAPRGLEMAAALDLPAAWQAALASLQSRFGRYAVGGIALANSIAVSLEVLLALWILRRRLGGMQGGELLGLLARVLLAGAAMALAMWAALAALPVLPAPGPLSSPFVNGLLRAGVGALIGGLVYGAAAWALRVEEVGRVLGALRARLPGATG